MSAATGVTLNDVMEFDHVIEVLADAFEVIDRPDIYPPELYDDEVSDGWTLMNGYSGQDRYSGPIMHQAEFIGGRMARDILTTPGIYVALVNYHLDDDGDSDSWAVAVRS